MKKGFTLVEITLVLMVIGVLAAILMPIAFQATPDDNVLKFKKSYNTLGTVIRELATTDKYYADGSFATRKDGIAIEDDDYYFCETMSELLATRTKDCKVENDSSIGGYVTTYDGTDDKTEEAKEDLDKACADSGIVGVQIVTTDGISWFEAKYDDTFPKVSVKQKDANGFDAAYKVICFDVDDFQKGEDPFGFGIRTDGKILSGKRADEWSQKSVQKGDN